MNRSTFIEALSKLWLWGGTRSSRVFRRPCHCIGKGVGRPIRQSIRHANFGMRAGKTLASSCCRRAAQANAGPPSGGPGDVGEEDG